jgi:serine/threonine protein kinase
VIGDLDLGRARRADRLFAELLDLDEVPRRERLALLRREDAAIAALLDRLLDAARCGTEASLGQALREGAIFAARARPEAGDAFAAGSRVGAWKIVEPLARGGMSRVFVAERVAGGFRQRAALKLFERSPERDSELVQRFEQERQILATLAHPNIARVLDGGVADDGRPYLVLELIEGEPIDRWCASRNPSLTERLQLFATAARAVQHAHSHLIVHRDLKPSNLLVDGSGVVKLLDFGIAKVLAGSQALDGLELSAPETRTTARPLTPAYASPEQIRGEPVQTASDVYQLGLLLYEMLAGRPAHLFREDSWRELERVVCEADPPPLAPSNRRSQNSADGTPTALSRIPADLETIVRKALQKDPERRYGSADRLADDVERFLADQPVLARPDTIRYRARKFVRRHRLAVGAASLVALLVLAGTIVVLLQSRQVAAERDRARSEARRSDEVSRFLVSIFRASSPLENSGEDPTAGELLRRGEERLEAELADEPALFVPMILQIAEMNYGLGHWSTAEKLARRGLEVAGRLPNSELFEAQALYVLAVVADVRGNPATAEPLARRCLELRRRHLEPGHPDIARVLTVLAEIAGALDRPAEAETAIEEALAILEALPELEPRALSGPLQVLGLAHLAQDEFESAEARTRQAFDLAVRSYGAADPRTNWVRSNLARVLEVRGKTEEAYELFSTALAMRRKLLGEDHPRYSVAPLHMARICLVVGEVDKAGALARETLAARERQLGEDHPETAGARTMLATVEREQLRFDAALRNFDLAGDGLRRAFGESHRRYRLNELHRGQVLVDLGRLPEAELLRPLAETVAVQGLASDQVLAALLLGRMDLAAGRDRAALREFARVVDAQRRLGDARLRPALEARFLAAFARARLAGAFPSNPPGQEKPLPGPAAAAAELRPATPRLEQAISRHLAALSRSPTP